MSKITVNLSFYNQEEILKKHVNGWTSWPEEILKNFSFCIVDDCSDKFATEVIKSLDISNIDLSVLRVKDDLYCNIAGVRNLSAQECKTDWMVILDMDTLITEKLAKSMLDLVKINSGNCFKFNRKVSKNIFHNKNGKVHPAVCLLRKEDYWKVGGCDEDLVGHYGQTDPMFWYRAKNKLNVHLKMEMFLEYEPRGQANINRDLSHNTKLFEQKRKNNQWSNEFIRFDWEKIY
tara:strand:- start:991 stop:1689 length:699 start_codon:yes stop_codon:yes gene_type:complete